MSGMDLVEFLTARLDEDEQSARAATGEAWNILTIGPEASPDDWVPIHLVVSGDDVAESRGDHGLAYAEHIARHDPARVLAEVEAKRAILDIHRQVSFTNVSIGIRDAAVCVKCHSVMDEPDDWPSTEEWSYPVVQDAYPCQTVRRLALPYMNHPDYRQEWKP